MSLDFTSKYDASFSGSSFWEQYADGFAAPGADSLEETAKIRIPGSNTTVIQKFGLATRTFEVPIAINAADFPTLAGKRGQTGTLTLTRGTFSVFFDGILQPRVTGSDLGIYNCTLRFTL